MMHSNRYLPEATRREMIRRAEAAKQMAEIEREADDILASIDPVMKRRRLVADIAKAILAAAILAVLFWMAWRMTP